MQKALAKYLRELNSKDHLLFISRILRNSRGKGMAQMSGRSILGSP
jgi:hypothetical protein